MSARVASDKRPRHQPPAQPLVLNVASEPFLPPAPLPAASGSSDSLLCVLVATPVGGELAVRVPRSAPAAAAALLWLLNSCSERLLGLDVESDTAGAVALLQLSTEQRALLLPWRLLFPPGCSATDAAAAVCACLADASLRKVGCELRKDALDLLHASAGQCTLRGGVDGASRRAQPPLLTAAPAVSPALLKPGPGRAQKMGLVDAFNARHPSTPVAKKDVTVTQSDWAALELAPEQLSYAALDAWMSFRLGRDERLLADPRARRVVVSSAPAAREAAAEAQACQALLRAHRLPAVARLLATRLGPGAGGGPEAAAAADAPARLFAVDFAAGAAVRRHDRAWVTPSDGGARWPAAVLDVGRRADGSGVAALAEDACGRGECREEGFALTPCVRVIRGPACSLNMVLERLKAAAEA